MLWPQNPQFSWYKVTATQSLFPYKKAAIPGPMVSECCWNGDVWGAVLGLWRPGHPVLCAFLHGFRGTGAIYSCCWWQWHTRVTQGTNWEQSSRKRFLPLKSNKSYLTPPTSILRCALQEHDWKSNKNASGRGSTTKIFSSYDIQCYQFEAL